MFCRKCGFKINEKLNLDKCPSCHEIIIDVGYKKIFNSKNEDITLEEQENLRKNYYEGKAQESLGQKFDKKGICPKCGTKRRINDTFCTSCGYVFLDRMVSPSTPTTFNKDEPTKKVEREKYYPKNYHFNPKNDDKNNDRRNDDSKNKPSKKNDDLNFQNPYATLNYVTKIQELMNISAAILLGTFIVFLFIKGNITVLMQTAATFYSFYAMLKVGTLLLRLKLKGLGRFIYSYGSIYILISIITLGCNLTLDDFTSGRGIVNFQEKCLIVLLVNYFIALAILIGTNGRLLKFKDDLRKEYFNS